jgi:hypothetical protein
MQFAWAIFSSGACLALPFSHISNGTIFGFCLCSYFGFLYRALKRVFGPKRDKVTGNGENYIMSLVICTPYPILCAW